MIAHIFWSTFDFSFCLQNQAEAEFSALLQSPGNAGA